MVVAIAMTTMATVMSQWIETVRHLNGVTGVPAATNVDLVTKGGPDCILCHLCPTDHVMSDCMIRLIAMNKTHLVTHMDIFKITTLVRILLF
jgi:hypothetical protein